jgi:ArsR family transcriptional regulator
MATSSARHLLDPAEFERVAKALADPRRFEILEAIAGAGELSCKALVDRFPIAQATVSHHLKELLVAGLVDVRQVGQCRYYRVRPGTLEQYLDEVRSRVAGNP